MIVSLFESTAHVGVPSPAQAGRVSGHCTWKERAVAFLAPAQPNCKRLPITFAISFDPSMRTATELFFITFGIRERHLLMLIKVG